LEIKKEVAVTIVLLDIDTWADAPRGAAEINISVGMARGSYRA
jgi:hypothetical protein